MNDTIPILNPALESDLLIKKIIFYGGKLNQYIINQISKIPIFDQNEAIVVLVVVYMLLFYILIKFGDALKLPLKIGIGVGIIYLMIGFFG